MNDVQSNTAANLPAGSLPSAALHPGIVVRVDRATALVECLDGGDDPVRATWGGPLMIAIGDDAEASPTTGDQVGLRYWPDGRITIDAVGPRRTLLTWASADGGSRRHVLAANIDLVAVVEALMPDPDLHRITQLLALAWASGAEPVVLLTKADLAPDSADLVDQVQAGSGCPVIGVSVITGDGVAQVRELLAGGRVMALLGASGAGKSSLVDALAGEEVMRVAQLHRICSGYVIDRPGLREVGLTGAAGLELTFADVVEFARSCRFDDCGHDGEPGCRVTAAVDRGELDQDRLEAWRQLVAEGDRQELRSGARLRSQERRKRKVLAKAVRLQDREKRHHGL